jgi:IS1 family transposase
LLFAYSPDNDEILTFVWGKRDEKTVREVYALPSVLDIDWICSDSWKAFAKVFPYKKHLIQRIPRGSARGYALTNVSPF